MIKTWFVLIVGIFFNINSFAVTESELQDVADCMAAFSITNSNMQMNGDHGNYKVGEKISSKLMDVFYNKLSDYKTKNPNVDSAYLGQMPNRAVGKYGYMNDLQQLKYAKSVMDVNNCFQYIRQN